jgi:hypothetical protein
MICFIVTTHAHAYLEIKVDDVVRMDIVDPLNDLLHEDAAGQLAQHKLLLDHPVKQLPPTNADQKEMFF